MSETAAPNSSPEHTPPVQTGTGTPSAVAAPLPERELLTAEIVAEEAERGDFVMHWAVILLAVLLGSFFVNDTRSLVHIKTGQYLLSHGVIPPSRDVFSYTANDRPWRNLGWLTDLILGGVYSAGGFMAVTGFKALLAGLSIALLMHITRPGMATWWGSICGALTIVAWHSQLVAQPALMTLFGMSALFLVWWTWQLTGKWNLWILLAVTAVWANLDPRAWIGPVCLVLYLVGERLGSQLGLPAHLSTEQRTLFAKVTGACCLALMLSPNLWHTWLSPLTMYGTVYPISRSYTGTVASTNLASFPLWSSQFWTELHVPHILALVLVVVTLLLQIANTKRLDLGLLLVWLGSVVIALPAAQQLPVAALVSCVVATLVGQAWYAANYSLEYTTSPRALVFSRGGRAITVLGLFTLALLIVVGRLRPLDGSRLGWGLSPELQGVADSYATVEKDALDNQPFHMTPSQGDLLIWAGSRCFIDQRFELYAGAGDQDLVALHKRVRDALRLTPQNREKFPPESKFSKEILDKYQITHVLPRLSGSGTPDYYTFSVLLGSPEWILTKVGPATAAFYRRSLLDKKEAADFLVKNQFDFGLKAIRGESETIPPRNAWVQLPNFYERYIWGVNRNPPPEAIEAKHLLQISFLSPFPRPQLAYQAIRLAQAGLNKNPNDASAYFLLGIAYQYLLQIESQYGSMSQNLQDFRYMQAVQALQQAATANPDDLETRNMLVVLYSQRNKIDLALRERDAIDRILQRIPVNDPEIIQLSQANISEMEKLSTSRNQVEKQAEQLAKQGQSQAFEIAAFYGQNGLVLKGLELLEQLPEDERRNPDLMLLQAFWLMESGRVEEAYVLSGQVQGIGEQTGMQNWQIVRCLSLLANGEYGAAGDLWNTYVGEQKQASLRSLLMPLAPRVSPAGQFPWPITLTEATAQHFYSLPQQLAAMELRTALIYLEAGQAKRATAALREILKQAPDVPERPLVALYIALLTGEEIDPVGPGDRVPLLFAPEEKP